MISVSLSLGKESLSHPPKGYVTLYLDCFKLGVKLSFQPYFVKVLGKMHLAPGHLNLNGMERAFWFARTMEDV